MNQVDLKYIYNRHLDRWRMYREQNLDRSRGIEDVSMAKQLRWIEGVSSFYQPDREFRRKGSMDQAIY